MVGERSSRRRLLVVLVGALLVRAAFAIPVTLVPARAIDIDSSVYLLLAEHFAAAYAHVDPVLAHYADYRTPGYPALLAVLGEATVLVVWVQVLLGVASVWLTHRLARALELPEGVALVAAVIMAVEPVSAVYSARIMSETAYVTIFLGGLVLWAEAIRRRSPVLVAVAGLVLGGSVLVRPIGLYLMLFLAVLTAVRLAGRRGLAMTALLLVGAGLTGGTWMARNAAVRGHLSMSSADGYNLVHNFAAGALAYDQHLSMAQAQQIIQPPEHLHLTRDDEADFALASRDTAAALPVVLHHPLGAARVIAEGVGRALLGPGRDEIAIALEGAPAAGAGFSRAVVWFSQAVAILVAVGAVFGSVALMARRRYWLACLLLGTAAYMLVLQALAIPYSRGRIPAEPMLAILAALGLSAAASSRRAGRLLGARGAGPGAGGGFTRGR